MQRAVRIAIKEAANLVLQLSNTHNRLLAQTPSHVLVGQPFATLNGVHEVPLDSVATAKGDVVATLNHPRAAAFADQAFDSNGDLGALGRCLLGMKGREQTRTTRAKDQNIRVVPFDIRELHIRSLSGKRVGR